jgi:hypothetical protein
MPSSSAYDTGFCEGLQKTGYLVVGYDGERREGECEKNSFAWLQ